MRSVVSDSGIDLLVMRTIGAELRYKYNFMRRGDAYRPVFCGIRHMYMSAAGEIRETLFCSLQTTVVGMGIHPKARAISPMNAPPQRIKRGIHQSAETHSCPVQQPVC